MKARRYNKGKLRYELISSIGLKRLAEVYTKGAEKYTLYNENGSIKEDGANNWRKGLSWMDTIGAVKRHIQEWEDGKDIDKELETYHLANAVWGLFSILDFYQSHPELDDRPHKYLHTPKIGLDIDEVICDWVGAWTKKFGYEIPENWNFSYANGEHFNHLTSIGELEDFYLSIPPKISPSELPFEPHCYITSRSVPVELTRKWIQLHGFPTVPVYSIGFEQSKVEVAKQSGLEIFVDDRYENFIELNKAGICTYLMDAAHNQRYNVGYKRIKSLKELVTN